MSDNVTIFYSASSNITFEGVIDTGVSKEVWSQMTEKERNEVVDDEIYNLLDVSVDDE